MTGAHGRIRHELMLRTDDFKPADRALIAQALMTAETVHSGQWRKPKRVDSYIREPYIVHPMRVALVLYDEVGHRDAESIAAALLHDVVEDSGGKVTTANLEETFNRNIALMVSVLSKPAADRGIPRSKQIETYIDRIANANLPTRLIKLSDRLDNIRDAIDCADISFQQRYLLDTLEVFVPLAQSTNAYLFEELKKSCAALERFLVEQI